MSDSAQILVAVDVDLATAAAVGEATVAWLVDQGVVAPGREVPRWGGDPFAGAAQVVGTNIVYDPGSAVMEAVAQPKDEEWLDFRDIEHNYVELVVGRRLFGADDVVFWCPRCRADCTAQVMTMASDWVQAGEASCTCGHCGEGFGFIDVVAPEPCALGCLALQFWNWWPLRETFLDELTQRLGTIRLVHERL